MPVNNRHFLFKIERNMMIYIHVPYCHGKCIYCDFYSGGNPDWGNYVRAALNELNCRIFELIGNRSDKEVGMENYRDLGSIYLGGGTPSMMPENEFIKLCNGIKKILTKNEISTDKTNFEFTIEVNPEDVTEEKARVWKSRGVNRISMGVQSLNDKELRWIKRRHSAEKALVSYNILKQWFNNISVDIMYGIPGQTIETLKLTLQQIMGLKPQHISAYALTYEPKTALDIMQKRGDFSPIGDDKYREMGEYITTELERHGYKRYEISNYSLPGYHSRHNSGYWHGKPYLGIGPSSCSYDGNMIRRNNPADLKSYIKYFLVSEKNTKTHFYEEEFMTAEELKEERIFLKLRTARGLEIIAYENEFGENAKKKMLDKAEKWVKKGEMEIVGGYLRFTNTGYWLSDYITVDLL